jgi:hypothetical protein
LFYHGLCWYSKNSPNQSITISFKTMELQIQSYRFQIQYQYSPRGWLVEGRLGSSGRWSQIDKREDEFVKQGAKPTDSVKITFQCQHQGKYSEFRFTMTGRNQKGDRKFTLNSIELFGNLFEYYSFE